MAEYSRPALHTSHSFPTSPFAADVTPYTVASSVVRKERPASTISSVSDISDTDGPQTYIPSTPSSNYQQQQQHSPQNQQRLEQAYPYTTPVSPERNAIPNYQQQKPIRRKYATSSGSASDTSREQRNYFPNNNNSSSLSDDGDYDPNMYSNPMPNPPAPPPPAPPGAATTGNIAATAAPRTRQDSLSDIGEAFRNQVTLGSDIRHDVIASNGRRTPTQDSPNLLHLAETVRDLQLEVETLRAQVVRDCAKREEMEKRFKQSMDIMCHNSKALIQNARIDVTKQYMRIHPLVNERGSFPDMAIFPMTVASLMKLNEAHLTSLVVFYGLEDPAPMGYYQKYTVLRDHLGIAP